jgi:hypothetical protein
MTVNSTVKLVKKWEQKLGNFIMIKSVYAK